MINRQTDRKRERDISQIWAQTGSKLIRDDKQTDRWKERERHLTDLGTDRE